MAVIPFARIHWDQNYQSEPIGGGSEVLVTACAHTEERPSTISLSPAHTLTQPRSSVRSSWGYVLATIHPLPTTAYTTKRATRRNAGDKDNFTVPEIKQE